MKKTSFAGICRFACAASLLELQEAPCDTVTNAANENPHLSTIVL